MADAICCLPPGATFDDILEKFKWLYGSVESFDTLMQEFYRIMQGKSDKVQTFVLHLERALKAIKQQHPYVMTEEDGHRHLKDCLLWAQAQSPKCPPISVQQARFPIQSVGNGFEESQNRDTWK